ncbi:Mitochondrial chaperone Frataxin [Saitozyma podzolica]|uniref:ferroxidase n=1 Tax=Saitozyma podzolica TaxID=1890683 RepID=A0A427YQ00_9TREE|nr:Mitochondrial chaperone Frataxin [Saitozyma podzolica]
MSASRTAIASLRPLVRARPTTSLRTIRTIRTLRSNLPLLSATSRPDAVSPSPPVLRPLHTSRPVGVEKSTAEAAANAGSSAGTDASTMKPNGSTGHGYVAEQDLDEVIVLNLGHAEYERVSEEDMDILHENLEELCERFGPEQWEVEYSSGVMTFTLPPHGTYVINKQPPNQQIWMSSPFSGPSRFDYGLEEEAWVHHRKPEVTLGTLLEGEIRMVLEKLEAEEVRAER